MAMMKRCVIALLGAMWALPGCKAGMYVDIGMGRDFPSHWSKRIHVPGIARTYQVDAHLYRGGSPDAEGLAALKKLGVRTVISLRSFHDQEAGARKAGLDYVRIPLNAWEGEIDGEMIRFLQVVADPSRGPFYVHCKRGSDRVGAAVAIYRICVCGWTKDEAVREMLAGDFGFLPFWRNLVRYVRQVDAEKLCRAAGLPHRGGGQE